MTIHDIAKTLSLATVITLAVTSLSSCKKNDFLGLKPTDQVSPDEYFVTADQLAGFTVNYYPTIFDGNSGWYAGRAAFDNGTDNQAASGGNLGMFYPGRWLVPATGGIGFTNIRNLNKFINETEAKHKEGAISGSESLINHYLGEAYVLRAMNYYGKLVNYGDYPILLEERNINDDLATDSRRMPRNEVARQIIADLDKGISLLSDDTFNRQRITRSAALVLKARVALFEGTFELYHRGSGRVPGDANWPGKDKEWNKGKTFDQDAEVKYFLSEAMKAAKEVGDKIALQTPNSHVMNPKADQFSGWNPYYDIFASADPSKFPEVILWQEYNFEKNVAHLTSNKLRTGSGTGWTRGLVESFLMKNGLPIYASGSGYHGDVTIDDAKSDRDERLQLFLFGESDNIGVENGKEIKFVEEGPRIIYTDEARDVTGYRQRKFYNYDPAMQLGQVFSDVSAQIHIRVAEAYLAYIEASYLLNNNIDATARKYWTALRARAGITAPIEATIRATNMSYEADVNRPSYDWGAFSAGKPVDATLYSIRRERRNEFCGEGFRMDDLKRWRAMDQVKDYQIEGVNFWDKIYTYKMNKADDGKSLIVADGGDKANISKKETTKYLRPYQVRKAYELFNGYTFSEAYYLSPFSVQEMELCSPTGKASDSNLYQNPYWPTYTGGKAEK